MASPQHKTCLSILRSIIGSVSGGEARFAKTIGRSRSWLKKASAGIIPISDDAAIRISYETGVAVQWLLEGNPKKHAVDKHGDHYTKAIFENHRVFMSESYDLEDAILSERSMYESLEEILRIYLTLQERNKGGLFSYRLKEAIDDLEAGLGVNYGKAKCQNEDIVRMAHNFAESIDENFTPNLVGGFFAPVESKTKASPKKKQAKIKTSTPQKKEPSRKPKRASRR